MKHSAPFSDPKRILLPIAALLFLAAVTAQTTLFGRVRFQGVKLSILPIAMVCIAMQVDHEAAGFIALLAGLCWYALGAEDGTLAIVTFPIVGILTGWLCCNVFSRRFFPALLLSLGALVIHEGALFLIKYYLGSAPGETALWVPRTIFRSLAVCPAIYPLAKLSGKAGGSR